MENIGLGLQLMLIGMITVFLILLIVIFGSQLLIKLINKIAPEESPKAAKGEDNLQAVFEAAVREITSGKGSLTKVTKL